MAGDVSRLNDGQSLRAYRPEGGICWSCQELLSAGELPICLDADILLPVCRQCWVSMPVESRMTLAVQFMDRWKGDSEGWKDALQRIGG